MKYLLASDIRLIYIDLDLVITSYIKSNVIRPKADIELYIPEDLEELAATIANIPPNKYVIIDSIDTLEALYNDHLISIYLSLLSMNSKIIVISRNRRWFLDHLSEVILSIDDHVKVIKPDIELEFDYY
jgi:hypothetical protein